jgi:two-component system nitrate/nitrite response regulator NarL
MTQQMESIRVLVVDESPGLTHDLLLSLRRRCGFLVLGPVADARAALETCAEVRPHVVLVQLDRSDRGGVPIVAALRNGSGTTRVMVATTRPMGRDVELALAAGACGVLAGGRDPASVADAFRRAIAGMLVLPVDGLPPGVDRLRDARSRWVQVALVSSLTAREREVLVAMAEGGTTPGIALGLGISPATVQTHVKNILGKLGVHSKVEAVGAAWRAGLATSARSA